MKSILLAIILLVIGCTSQASDISTGAYMVQNTYTQITQEQAKEMMSTLSDYIILDVRRQDEYATGHIPGAICIPNESITTEPPKELNDLNQTILVYCRSGNRSKQASQKLAGMGYTNVYEFGGIIDWIGEIITGEETVKSTPVLVLEANGNIFYASLEDNSSAQAFIDKLNSGGIDVDMHDYGSFEKVGNLPWNLPRNDEQITTEPGDIILYQGNQITVYYDRNSWNFTRLAKITGATRDELLSAFGSGDVNIRFSLEWDE